MDNYIKLDIPMNNAKILNKYLLDLFTVYKKEDVYFEVSDNEIELFLNQIDFYDFKNRVVSMADNANDEISKMLMTILTSVENIKSYGLKGKKRIYFGYGKERKVRDRKGKEKIRGSYYYALNNNFSKINNVVPDEFKNKIINGDSSEVLKQFPDNCVDLIFTSPPYNFGLDYENNEDGIDWNEYFSKLFDVFSECIRVLKYGGRIAVNVQPLFSDYIPIHHIISNYFMENKLIWRGEILWDKHNYNCKYTAWGSWKSPSNPYLKYTWEFIEIFCKGDLKHVGDVKNADIDAEEFKKWVFAKWDIPPEFNMKKYGHPAMFPEALTERVIKLFSFKNDIILDPFNGVGTTTAVAKKFSRNFVGIDISKEYCIKAEQRIKETIVDNKLL